MNIGLIAVDSTFPNLALMKIARFHRSRGEVLGDKEWRGLAAMKTAITHWQPIVLPKNEKQ